MWKNQTVIRLGVLALAAMSSVSGKLSVTGPDELKELFKDSQFEINAQLANFGHIPYGQSMVSKFALFSNSKYDYLSILGRSSIL
jgi:hypothetical protein